MKVHDFEKLDTNDRIRAIMLLGEVVELNSYPVFDYAITQDKDNDVQMAALKRIHKFKSIADVDGVLRKMMSEKSQTHLEPYFSMALLNVGIISESEFNRIFSSNNKEDEIKKNKLNVFSWSIFQRKDKRKK